MSAEALPRRPLATALQRGAAIGLATTAGWLVCDLAIYFTSQQPSVARFLLPGSLVALLVGAALGALAGRFPLALLAYAALGLWSSRFHDQVVNLLTAALSPLGVQVQSEVLIAYLGVVVTFWSAAFALARFLPRLIKGLRPTRAAACLGLGAAILSAYAARDELRPHWELLAAAALATLLLGWERIPRRGLATAAVLLGTGLFLAYKGLGPTRVSYWREDLPPPTATAGDTPSAVLVVLDTVRSQSLAPYGYDRVTTPRIDAWVREQATLYGESRSTSSFTLASHGSLFTGVLPAQHGAARLRPSAEPLAPGLPTLAERLRSEGYQTGAIVANHTYLSPEFDMDRGFERFDHRDGSWVGEYVPLAQLLGHEVWAGHVSFRDAETVTDAALEWLDERRERDPFFLMLNYLDAHEPYLTRAPHDSLFEDVVLTNPFRIPQEHDQLAYDRNLHFLDSEIGRLLDGIEARGLVDDTLIVITSDHGEGFGEHGFHEHCWVLYEEMVRVPLYVKPPGGRRAERDDTPVTSADVHWMILDELGVPYGQRPAASSMVSEWYRQVPMTENYVAMSEQIDTNLDRDLVAWIEDGRKVIVSTLHEVEAFDLARDPWEQSPLELTPEEIDRALLRALEWWDAHPLSARQTEVIPADQMERLRALGYVGPETPKAGK